MIHGEGFSGAAHAGHDFVCDEKNSAAAADFAEVFYIAFGWSCCAECGADYRFEDEGGDGRGIICGEERFEIVGAGKLAIGKSFVEGTGVAEAGREVAPFREKGLIRAEASAISGEGLGAGGVALGVLAGGEAGELIVSA